MLATLRVSVDWAYIEANDILTYACLVWHEKGCWSFGQFWLCLDDLDFVWTLNPHLHHEILLGFRDYATPTWVSRASTNDLATSFQPQSGQSITRHCYIICATTKTLCWHNLYVRLYGRELAFSRYPTSARCLTSALIVRRFEPDQPNFSARGLEVDGLAILRDYLPYWHSWNWAFKVTLVLFMSTSCLQVLSQIESELI